MKVPRAALLPPALVLLLAVFVSAFLWWQVEETNDQAERQARQAAELRAAQLADAMAGQIKSLLGTMDLGLREVRAAWLRNPADAPQIARTVLATLPEDMATHLSIVDADGYTVYSTVKGNPRTYVGDREHFRVQQSGMDRLLIGNPIQARLIREWSFVVNRPVLDKGRFAGTVNISVRTDAVAALLARLHLNDRDLVALLRSDGSFLARSLDNPAAMGKAIPADRPFLAADAAVEGNFHQPGTLDQVNRIYAWRRLPEVGLVTIVGLNESALLAPLQAERQADRGTAALISILLLLGGLLLAALYVRLLRQDRQLREDNRLRRQAEEALARSHAELERRVAERTAELAMARDEAEGANRAKSEFLSRMSHELRTPLNAVIGFAQMLELPGKTALSAQQADSVQEILKAGRHLLGQVNEVLDLARIDSGRIELHPEPVGVALAVADCVAQVKPLAAQRGIAMTAAIDSTLAVRADPTRLQQLLLNLLSNAIKYNRDDGRIEVTAGSADGRVRIAVRDTGRGIAPEKLASLFKPFERIESSYDGIEGTGIGLALVKRLVEAMGGELGVSSAVGAGSSFWFALPAARLPELPDQPMPKVGAGGTAPVHPSPGRHVLYIEDNPANLKLVRKMLGTRADLVMSEAPDAERGLDLARREPPDLILLDINLPGMDGFAALRQLQAMPETAAIPVVAITANAMKRDIERGRAAGFADYLTKPVELGKLLETIDRCLPDRKEKSA